MSKLGPQAPLLPLTTKGLESHLDTWEQWQIGSGEGQGGH